MNIGLKSIRLSSNQEAMNRFFFCSNSNCLNFGLEKKEESFIVDKKEKVYE